MSRFIAFCLLVILIIALAGCASILEDETRDETLHETSQNERPPAEQIEVSSYDELKAAMLELVSEHEADAQMVVYSYEGDVRADVSRAIGEIMDEDPIAIYAVADIEGTVTRIVSYFEITVSIDFKRTKEQAESIVTVSTDRYLRTELQNAMSDYREEVVFLTSLQVSEEDIAGYVREIYYQNPRTIVMMPVMVIDSFPAGGNNRFIELRFVYLEEVSVLQQFGTSLAGYVQRNALAAGGENDGEILLSLVENLVGACSYDSGTARTISEHGVQNLAATAYQALVRGSAVGEGFAMAFKALCDELRFDCRVVLGSLGGMVHAWNIVSLYGDYYHIDVAMCAQNGVETAFLMKDVDMIRGYYSWDIQNSVRCNGPLTYNDIVGIEEENPEDDDDDDDDDEGSGDREQGTGDEGDEESEGTGLREQGTGDGGDEGTGLREQGTGDEGNEG